MLNELEKLVDQYDERRLTRRELVAGVLALVVAGRPGPAAAQATQVAQARSLNHVSLAVSDVERSAEFYQSLLGLEVVSRPGNGGINLGLRDGFLGLYGLPDVGHVNHFCLGVDDYDPNRIAAALGAQGIDARVDTNPRNRTSGGYQLYFNDPDGTTVQLSANGYHG
jgi:catechol 2,3-dioxygenase-like lactoylglutathione lyase family enzyme